MEAPNSGGDGILEGKSKKGPGATGTTGVVDNDDKDSCLSRMKVAVDKKINEKRAAKVLAVNDGAGDGDGDLMKTAAGRTLSCRSHP